MRESRFGFEYSWADLKPVRALVVTSGIAQAAGALAGFALLRDMGWFESIWFGAAMATFPGFVIGAFIQAAVEPGSLAENKIMVRRLGSIAAFLGAIALLMVSVWPAR